MVLDESGSRVYYVDVDCGLNLLSVVLPIHCLARKKIQISNIPITLPPLYAVQDNTAQNNLVIDSKRRIVNDRSQPCVL